MVGNPIFVTTRWSSCFLMEQANTKIMKNFILFEHTTTKKNDTWILIYVFVLTSVPLKVEKVGLEVSCLCCIPLSFKPQTEKLRGTHFEIELLVRFFSKAINFQISIPYHTICWRRGKWRKKQIVEKKNRLMFHVGKMYCNYNLNI